MLAWAATSDTVSTLKKLSLATRAEMPATPRNHRSAIDADRGAIRRCSFSLSEAWCPAQLYCANHFENMEQSFEMEARATLMRQTPSRIESANGRQSGSNFATDGRQTVLLNKNVLDPELMPRKTQKHENRRMRERSGRNIPNNSVLSATALVI